MTDDLLRCAITTNPCGTDTWAKGSPCLCPACTAYVTIRAQAERIELLEDQIASLARLCIEDAAARIRAQAERIDACERAEAAERERDHAIRNEQNCWQRRDEAGQRVADAEQRAEAAEHERDELKQKLVKAAIGLTLEHEYEITKSERDSFERQCAALRALLTEAVYAVALAGNAALLTRIDAALAPKQEAK